MNFAPDKALMRQENGPKYTRRLFYETSYGLNDKTSTIYTLKDQDHPDGYISLYRLYMDEEDLTEYRFAEKYLIGWSHWLILQECVWFKPYINRWRDELRNRIRSKAQDAIKAALSGQKTLEAARLLLDLTNPPKAPLKGVGRPKKVAEPDIESQAEFEDDLKRMKEG
jgi:hypothetical protein